VNILVNFTVDNDEAVIHRVARSFVLRRGKLVACIQNRSFDGGEELDPGEKELLALKARREYAEFIRVAVQLRKNIVVSGSMGTGKTTASNALVLEVPRARARSRAFMDRPREWPWCKSCCSSSSPKPG